MPKRPPPSPPALVVLLTVAALVACWVAIAVEQAARGAAALAVGVPWPGLELSSAYTVVSVQGPTAALGPAPFTLVSLAGPAALLLVALSFHFVVGWFRTSGWLRALALEGAILALLWVPSALAVAVFQGSGGSVSELYGRLGEPQAGRWGALALGLLTLWLVGGVASARAVAVGRGWMRTDGLGFRRRLVRVVAGYPAVLALGAAMYVQGWVAPVWSAVWLVVVLGVMVIRTP